MTFKTKVKQIDVLSEWFCKGMSAVPKRAKSKIRAKTPRSVTGSVDIDAALKASHPRASRWDYAVGWQDKEVYWIEVHPASGGNAVSDLIAKLDWLLMWLDRDGQPLKSFRGHFIWIASGGSAFSKSSPQLRRLSERGVMFVGEHLEMPYLP
jgi:hypothetical protein